MCPSDVGGLSHPLPWKDIDGFGKTFSVLQSAPEEHALVTRDLYRRRRLLLGYSHNSQSANIQKAENEKQTVFAKRNRQVQSPL